MPQIIHFDFKNSRHATRPADKKPQSAIEKAINYYTIPKDFQEHLHRLCQGGSIGAAVGAISPFAMTTNINLLEKFVENPDYAAFAAIAGASAGLLAGIITGDQIHRNTERAVSDNVYTYRTHYKKVFSR